MPKPYWFLSGLVIAFAHARKSSKFQSSFGGFAPYSFARSVRQYTPSFVTTHGTERTRFLTVTVSHASGSTSLKPLQSFTLAVRSSTAFMPSNSPTQLSQTWATSGAVPAALEV